MRRRYIVILGSGYSGSGAVFDYLSGLDSFHPALSGSEFRLIVEPDGLNDLFHQVSDGFHPNRANSGIQRFYRLAMRCSTPRSSSPKGLGYENVVNGYNSKVKAYIEKITLMKYEGMPWVELSKKNKLHSFVEKSLKRVYKKINVKKSFGTVYVPVSEEEFLNRTSSFLHEILAADKPENEKKTILVNQGGSYWRPEESTCLYGSRKVILVDRDPRDIFADLKYKGNAYPGSGVDEFCFWYENMMSRKIKDWDPDVVFNVSFEDFVNEDPGVFADLSKFLGFSFEYFKSSGYSLHASRKNIGRFRKVLGVDEIKVIEKRLARFIGSI